MKVKIANSNQKSKSWWNKRALQYLRDSPFWIEQRKFRAKMLTAFKRMWLLAPFSKTLRIQIKPRSSKHCLRASSYEPGWPGWLGYRDEIGVCSLVTFSPLSEMKNLNKWWHDHSGVKSNEQAWQEFLGFLCLNSLKFLLTYVNYQIRLFQASLLREKRIKSSVMSVLSRKCIVLFSSR